MTDRLREMKALEEATKMHKQVSVPPKVIVRPRRRKWKRWLFLTVVVLAASWYAVQFLQGPAPIAITTDKAAVKDIAQLVSATGKIRPESEIKISPEVAGEIIELPVVDGQSVKRGDVLVKIKPDNYIANVQQSEASLSAAEADCLQRKSQMLNDQLDLRRAEDIYQKRVMSETDFKAAQTKSEVSVASYQAAQHRVDQARFALDQAKVLLAKCVIYSPIDGTVSVLNSELGERVVATGDFAGTEVMRVANLDAVEARVDVNENDVVNVKVGDPVRIRIDAYPGHEFRGTVKRIASTATVQNQGTQQEVTNFEVRIQILQPDRKIRPGMSASVEIETQTVQNVVSIPIQSVTVRSRDNGKTAEQLKNDRLKDQGGVSTIDAERLNKKRLERVVFIKQGDKVKMVPVESGIADDNYIEIQSGVKAGDEVIAGSYTAISRDLKDGSKVKIEPPKDVK
ncbi:MAG TPA: efflux RND transporter periplasmic adaptor subunit [Chthoniobacterales bacterium]|nr:efflux RND transporter periplasmic adaptor subunit [Chthoniobacterales bacterium]